jgi:hypothetical protein
MRINGATFSKQNIMMITNNIFVPLNTSVDQKTMHFLKNANNVIDECFKTFLNKNKITDNLTEFIIKGILNNILDFDFTNPKYQTFINSVKSTDWLQISLHQFNENLAKLVLQIINEDIFFDFSKRIALIIVFLFPLFYKMHPISIKFKSNKEFDRICESNDLNKMFDFISRLQDEGESEFKKIEMS